MLYHFYVTCLVVVGVAMFVHPVAAKHPCQCTKRTARCLGLNLTYIPLFPNSIVTVDFVDNYLPYINATTFKNLTNLALKSLHLPSNHVQHIAPDAFRELTTLKSLDLSGNNLTQTSLRNIFTQYTTQLYGLKLQSIGLKTIPGDLLKNYESDTLHNLDLSYNYIEEFNFTVFNTATRLHILTLKSNHISSVTFDYQSNLRNLSFVNNSLCNLPDFCNNQTFFPKLNTIQLNINIIDKYIPSYISCMKNLKHLDLSMNAIVELKPNSFRTLPSLNWLSITSQRPRGRKFINIHAKAFNNPNLESLLLTQNSIPTKYLDPLMFYGCTHLKMLELSHNMFAKQVDKLDVALSNLTSLTTLKLQDVNLASIPNVVGRRLIKLEYLDVGYNDINSWPPDFFFNNTHLNDVNIRHNNIQTITQQMFPDYLKKRLHTITISANPLVCNCDLVWFIHWVKHAKFKFKDHNTYKCMNITERLCLNNTKAFIAVTSLTSLLVVIILLISVIYRYRWSIKYHMYMWRYRPIKLMNIAQKHFQYDVFVSYCEADSDWVIDQVIPTIEQGENIKLCIHERDFVGGKMIIDNIIYHMENSRKCLIVLSNDFARSEWCQFEMTLAQKLVLDMCIESLVVVLLEDIEAGNMSKSLHALLTTTTYISCNDEDEEDILWGRLKTSLKNTDNSV